MKRLCGIILLTLIISGCDSIPIKDGGLAVGKNTTAGIEDIGVGKLTSKF